MPLAVNVQYNRCNITGKEERKVGVVVAVPYETLVSFESTRLNKTKTGGVN